MTVRRLLAVEAIVAVSADDRVVGGAAVDRQQRATGDRVGVGGAERVDAAEAVDDEALGLEVDLEGARARPLEQNTAGVARLVGVDLVTEVVAVADDRVVAGTTGVPVGGVAVVPRHRVVPVAAVGGVFAFAADEAVVAGGAVLDVDAVAAVDGVVAVTRVDSDRRAAGDTGADRAERVVAGQRVDHEALGFEVDLEGARVARPFEEDAARLGAGLVGVGLGGVVAVAEDGVVAETARC